MVPSPSTTVLPKYTGNMCVSHVTGLNMTGKVSLNVPFSTSGSTASSSSTSFRKHSSTQRAHTSRYVNASPSRCAVAFCMIPSRCRISRQMSERSISPPSCATMITRPNLPGRVILPTLKRLVSFGGKKCSTNRLSIFPCPLTGLKRYSGSISYSICWNPVAQSAAMSGGMRRKYPGRNATCTPSL